MHRIFFILLRIFYWLKRWDFEEARNWFEHMGGFTIRAKKFISNPLLARKQCVLEVIIEDPNQGSKSENDLKEVDTQLNTAHDANCREIGIKLEPMDQALRRCSNLIDTSLEKLLRTLMEEYTIMFLTRTFFFGLYIIVVRLVFGFSFFRSSKCSHFRSLPSSDCARKNP